MLNFLPVNEKKQLRREYIMRLIIIILSGLTLVFLIGVILLLPAYFLSVAKENAYVDRSAGTRDSSKIDEQEDLNNVLRDIQQKIDILAIRDDNSSLKVVFDTILMHRENGVEITSIFYTKSDTTVTLNVSGIADTRENLLIFSRSLENDPLFSDIELPVSNLAKDRDIAFKIEIEGNF